MRVLVCGDRGWSDRETMRVHLSQLSVDVIIIEGEARGADRMARELAELEFDWTVIPFPANWSKYGRAAGPIRNQQMLDEGRPDLVLAFHDDIEHSKGTKDMVNRARRAGIPVEVITGE